MTSSLRTAVRSTMFGSGLAAGMVFVGGAPADAQTTEPAPSDGVNLPQISVQGAQPDNTLQGTTGLGRLPGRIQDQPQTIQVVPREIMQQQGVTTLQEALRNVPGITSSIGEGNGGVNGDQLRIRGFNSQNDLYVDGLRDFGSFRRDAFTFEEVQALLGPSGVNFGSGAAGGVVNITSRTPHLGNSFSADVTGGMDFFLRATADANYQFSDTGAFRLNIMGQTGRTVDRDLPRGERWGIAPSLAFGLGTDTTVTLEYLYYRYDEPADAGVPIVTRPGTTVGRPVTEFGVPRGTWYGSNDTDRDQATVNRLTARLQHRASDWLTLYNDTRLGFADKFYSFSVVSCDATCVSRLFSGSGTPQYSLSGGGSPYTTQTWGIQNISTAVARFNTWSLRHEATLGVDLWYEDFQRTTYTYSSSRTAFRGNLFAPDNDVNFLYSVSTGATAQRQNETTQAAIFASDRIWFTPEISVLAGLRWTRQQSDYTSYGGTNPVSTLNADNSFLDPRVSLIWEPTPQYTLYASYAQSTFAPGSNWATQPGQASANNSRLEPERSTIYEIGGRASILDDRLGLSASVYQIEKDNATETDPSSGTVFSSGDQQRIRGLDLGVSGRITPAWRVNARYSYMNSETTSSLTAANVGKRVVYVPEHAASLWTSYEIAQGTPWNVTVGGGFTWQTDVYTNAANTAEVPYAFSLDAFVSHRINDQLTVRINGYNLTDNRNYVQVFGNRAVMGPGRAVTATVGVSF
ncbi:TonB-dependent siderophore receptor [Roseomonas eburnea]|uniref:TonB-dependent siderophore receptor n=1 Tax=Neoroseomonas eburnea TaxID=1346889 RepID=A0A9X9X9S5_9PROT|nr:TonB-dependent siderophore receptor [Neoroseomonas eburnea]MBR0680461.1 TonB-dependent siderophore receptor [Neoroseomonas eburnea]